MLDSYAKSFGQLINFNKSSVFFSFNTDYVVLSQISNLLGVPLADNLERYLGLPCAVRRGKMRAFAYLKDRVRSCINS